MGGEGLAPPPHPMDNWGDHRCKSVWAYDPYVAEPCVGRICVYMCAPVCVCVGGSLGVCADPSRSVSQCQHQPLCIRVCLNEGQLLRLSVCACVRMCVYVSLTVVSRCVCPVRSCVHSGDLRCEGGVCTSVEGQRWQCALYASREGATMSSHKCVPLGVGVSWCGLLFPRGVRMFYNIATDNAVGFSVCFHRLYLHVCVHVCGCLCGGCGCVTG